MVTTTKPSKKLQEHLAQEYPFRVDADPKGGYVITFPDLPGCMTQVDTIQEVASAADEIRRLWIATEFEAGDEIPPPSYPETYSGKFNVRLPKSLHRKLAHRAEREGISLNQMVVALLAEGVNERQ